MRDFLKNLILLMFCVILVTMVAKLTRHQDAEKVSTAELLIQPSAALQLEAQRQQAALDLAQMQTQGAVEQARIAAEVDEARSEANTLRFYAGLIALVLLAGMYAWLTAYRERARQAPPRLLYPNDPEFYVALRELGGQRRNGVPMIDGVAVPYITAHDNRRSE